MPTTKRLDIQITGNVKPLRRSFRTAHRRTRLAMLRSGLRLIWHAIRPR